jgi:hypothetical protein
MDNPETLALGTLNTGWRQTKLKKHLWELTQCTIKKKGFLLLFQAHGGAGVSNNLVLTGIGSLMFCLTNWCGTPLVPLNKALF